MSNVGYDVSADGRRFLMIKADKSERTRTSVMTIRPPRVNPRELGNLRGRLHLCSIETLIEMLDRLRVQVRLVVKRSRP